MFFALEGGEGSGKDTQIDILKERMNPGTTVFTREPGGTPIGNALRAFLLDPTTHICPEAELVSFLAARVVLLEHVIRPALAAGKTVISNRFGLSTIAYQIYGRERMQLLPWLEESSAKIVGEDMPAYILLDIDPALGLERVAKRKETITRFDAERLEFHGRVRGGYLNHYKTAGADGVRIDAAQPIEAVAAQIWEFIENG